MPQNKYLPPRVPRPRRGTTVSPSDVAREAERQQVDPLLAVSVAKNESNGRTNARSPKGAQGPMQLMPATGQALAKKAGERYNPADPQQNVRLGVSLLKELTTKHNGDLGLVAGDYNSGAVSKYKGKLPPYRETQNYVRRVHDTYQQMASHLGDVDQVDDVPETPEANSDGAAIARLGGVNTGALQPQDGYQTQFPENRQIRTSDIFFQDHPANESTQPQQQAPQQQTVRRVVRKTAQPQPRATETIGRLKLYDPDVEDPDRTQAPGSLVLRQPQEQGSLVLPGPQSPMQSTVEKLLKSKGYGDLYTESARSLKQKLIAQRGAELEQDQANYSKLSKGERIKAGLQTGLAQAGESVSRNPVRGLVALLDTLGYKDAARDLISFQEARERQVAGDESIIGDDRTGRAARLVGRAAGDMGRYGTAALIAPQSILAQTLAGAGAAAEGAHWDESIPEALKETAIGGALGGGTYAANLASRSVAQRVADAIAQKMGPTYGRTGAELLGDIAGTGTNIAGRTAVGAGVGYGSSKLSGASDFDTDVTTLIGATMANLSGARVQPRPAPGNEPRLYANTVEGESVNSTAPPDPLQLGSGMPEPPPQSPGGAPQVRWTPERVQAEAEFQDAQERMAEDQSRMARGEMPVHDTAPAEAEAAAQKIAELNVQDLIAEADARAAKQPPKAPTNLDEARSRYSQVANAYGQNSAMAIEARQTLRKFEAEEQSRLQAEQQKQAEADNAARLAEEERLRPVREAETLAKKQEADKQQLDTDLKELGALSFKVGKLTNKEGERMVNLVEDLKTRTGLSEGDLLRRATRLAKGLPVDEAPRKPKAAAQEPVEKTWAEMSRDEQIASIEGQPFSKLTDEQKALRRELTTEKLLGLKKQPEVIEAPQTLDEARTAYQQAVENYGAMDERTQSARRTFEQMATQPKAGEPGIFQQQTGALEAEANTLKGKTDEISKRRLNEINLELETRREIADRVEYLRRDDQLNQKPFADEGPKEPSRETRTGNYSLTEFVRRNGGIKLDDTIAGEMRRASENVNNRIGLVNNRAGERIDFMRQMANEAGYGPYETVADFVNDIENGDKVFSSARQVDIAKMEAEDGRGQTEAEQAFLDDPGARRAFDHVTGGDLSAKRINELDFYIRKYNLPAEYLDEAIGEGKRARAGASGSNETSPATLQSDRPESSRTEAPPRATRLGFNPWEVPKAELLDRLHEVDERIARVGEDGADVPEDLIDARRILSSRHWEENPQARAERRRADAQIDHEARQQGPVPTNAMRTALGLDEKREEEKLKPVRPLAAPVRTAEELHEAPYDYPEAKPLPQVLEQLAEDIVVSDKKGAERFDQYFRDLEELRNSDIKNPDTLDGHARHVLRDRMDAAREIRRRLVKEGLLAPLHPSTYVKKDDRPANAEAKKQKAESEQRQKYAKFFPDFATLDNDGLRRHVRDLGRMIRALKEDPQARKKYQAAREAYVEAKAEQAHRELVSARINQAAHEAATSPLNDKTEPSPAQIEAGNYPKGHVRLHGLDISIENPQGSTRSGVGRDGKEWSVKMGAHYGYIRRVGSGADGEQIDVYIGDHPTSERVFVVDQVDAESRKFDEHKVFLGARSREEAEALYDAHFDDGRGADRRGAITEMSITEFKDWLNNGNQQKPIARKLQLPPRQKAVKEKPQANLFDETVDNGSTIAAKENVNEQSQSNVQAEAGLPPVASAEPAETTPVERKAPAASRQSREGSAGDVRTADRERNRSGRRENDGHQGTHHEPTDERGAPTEELAGTGRAESTASTGSDDARTAEQQPSSTHRVDDYHITDLDSVAPRGSKTKLKANIRAIELLAKLGEESRTPTAEEQAQLAGYTGWGQFPGVFNEVNAKGDDWAEERTRLKELLTPEEYAAARHSTLNAHYTHPKVVDAMWRMAKKLGFTGGRTLEPASGVGVFFGLMPRDVHGRSSLTGVELDPTTAKIASYLYPNASIKQMGFESFKVPDEFFGLIISNVPFSDTNRPVDERYRKFNAPIHDYFFLKSADLVRPGGLMMFITSTGTLDKVDDKTRRELAEKMELVSAMRLPDGAFKENAGTDVVTDLLILKKRAQRVYLKDEEMPAWVRLGKVPDPDGGQPIPINQYYVENPSQVLGTVDRKSKMYRGDAPHVSMTKDFEARFEAAISNLPAKVMTDRTRSVAFDETTVVERDKRLFDGSFVEREGRIYRQVGDTQQPVELSGNQLRRVSRMIKLRNTMLDLLHEQQKGGDRAKIDDLRARLNQIYDHFTFNFGVLHSQANTKLFMDDPSHFRLLALEDYDPQKKTAKKADIFTKDVVGPVARRSETSDVASALAASLFDLGYLAFDRVVKTAGKSQQQVADELVTKQLAFEDPKAGWMTAEAYLSGNVRKKLIEAREAAAVDAKFAPNVKALEAVQPPDIPLADITANLGAPWIPASDYSHFLNQLVEAKSEYKVSYYPATHRFSVQQVDYGQANVAKVGEHATKRASFKTIAEAALNSSGVQIWDTIDDKGTKVLNIEESERANEKVEALKQAFYGWVFSDTERATRLHRYYNDNFNNMRRPQFSVEHYRDANGHLRLPGMAPGVSLREHQARDIWHAVTKGKMLDATEVGGGKTFILIGAAMEWKRLGMAAKPAIAVPKAIIEDFVKAARELYPAARILTTYKNFDAKKRKKVVSRIATGDYDLIIMTHDNLNMLPMRPEYIEQFMAKEIRNLEEAIKDAKDNNADNRIVKQMEKRMERLQNRIKASFEYAKKDNAVFFEDSGIDGLLVDEFHYFKSLPVFSNQQIKGVPSGESMRAVNMLARARYLLQQNNDRNVVAATGTPITNTLVELFNMQRFLQPKELEDRGIEQFDAWSATFAAQGTRMEFTMTGKIEPVTRLREFVNIPDLQEMVGDVMEVNLLDELGVQRPRLKEEIIKVERTPEQARYLAFIQQRYDHYKSLKGKEKLEYAKEDNPLKISTDARKFSLDLQLNGAGFKPEHSKKIAAVVDNVLRIVKENPGKTQMIFSDFGIYQNAWGFSVYKAIIDGLVKGGVPRDKIIDFSQFASGGGKKTKPVEVVEAEDSANEDSDNEVTDEEAEKQKVLKEEAARKLKTGQAWIGIGGSHTLGTGVNAQDLLIAMHHVDTPWIPAYLEQRNGRGFRQGNINPEVMAYYYVTEKSFDTVMYQIVSYKYAFIKQFMKGGKQRTMKNEEGDDFSPEQIMAVASGNPYLLEKMTLEQDVRKLRRQQRDHRSEDINRGYKINDLQRLIARRTREIEMARTDREKYQANKGDSFKMVINGKVYDAVDKAGNYLAFTLEGLRDASGEHKVGEFRGFDLVYHPKINALRLKGADDYDLTVDFKEPIVMPRSAIATASKIGNSISVWEEDVAEAERDIENLKAAIGKPWPNEQLLKDKEARLEEVTKLAAQVAEQEKTQLEAEHVSGKAEKELLDALKTAITEKGTGPLSIADVRAFSSLTKEQFDQAALKLAEQKQITLQSADIANLSDEEKAQLIADGDVYYGVIAQAASSASLTIEAEAGGGGKGVEPPREGPKYNIGFDPEDIFNSFIDWWKKVSKRASGRIDPDGWAWFREIDARLREMGADANQQRDIFATVAEGLRAFQRGDRVTMLRKQREVAIKLNKLKRSSSGQIFLTYIKAGMLSGLHLSVDNFISNSAHLVAEVATLPTQVAVDLALSKITGRRATGGLTVGDLRASATEGAIQGLREMGQVMRYGISDSELAGLAPGDKYTRGEVHTGNTALDFFLRLPFRIQSAGDKPFWNIAFVASLHGQARLTTKGLKGQARRDAIEKVMATPPSELKQIAADVANQLTLAENNRLTDAWYAFLEGMRGSATTPRTERLARGGQQIGEGARNIVGDKIAGGMANFMEFVTPFVKVPTNFVRVGLEFSGLRLPDRIYSAAKAGKRMSRAEQARYARQIGNGIFGLIGFLGAGFLLGALGLLEDEDNRRGVKATKQAAGIQPNSLRIPGTDKRVSTKWLGPTGWSAQLGAGLANAFKSRPGDEQKESGKVLQERTQRAANSVGKRLLDLPMLRTVNNQTGIISDENKTGAVEAAKRTAENMASSLVPYSGAVNEVGQATDEFKRSPRNLNERMSARLPVLRKKIPAMVTATGEKVKEENPLVRGRVSTEDRKGALAEAARLQLPLPRQKAEPGESAKDAERRAIEYGKGNKRAIESGTSSSVYKSLPDRSRYEMLKTMVNREKQDVAADREPGGKQPRTPIHESLDTMRIGATARGLEQLRADSQYLKLDDAGKKAAEDAYQEALRKGAGSRANTGEFGKKGRAEKLPKIPDAGAIRLAQIEAINAGRRAMVK